MYVAGADDGDSAACGAPCEILCDRHSTFSTAARGRCLLLYRCSQDGDYCVRLLMDEIWKMSEGAEYLGGSEKGGGGVVCSTAG